MNNSCSTDFIDECMKDDFPYKVIFPDAVFKPSVSCDIFGYGGRLTPIEPKEKTRFDLLDIKEENKSKYSFPTIEKIANKLNKMKEDVLGNKPIWKEEEKPHISLSEDYMLEMIRKDFEILLKKSMREYIEKTQITNRFEILDL